MPHLVANDITDKNYEDVLKDLSEGGYIRLATDAEVALAKKSTWYLGRHVLDYDWLESKFHRALARFYDKYWNECQLHLHPRGHLKTTLLTITGSIRRIINDPDWTIGICANTDDNAKKIIHGIRSHFVKNEKFRDLFPEHAVRTKRDEGTTEKFTTPARTKYWITVPTVESFSIKTAAVSRHYWQLIFEDVQDAKNSRTKALRDEVERIYSETLSLIDPLPQTGVSLHHIIGTRWHHDDLYGRILNDERRGDHRFKVLITSFRKKNSDGEYDLLFPERRTQKYFDNMLTRQGPYVFSCQYENRPIRDEDKDFDISDLEFYEDIDGKMPFEGPYNRYILVDPGGWDEVSGVVTRDVTVVAVYDVNQSGEIYVREINRGVWNPDEQISEIFKAVLKWRPLKVGVEIVAWQKALSFWVRRRMEEENINVDIEGIKRGVTSKKDRILRISPYLSGGKIFVDRSKVGSDILISELDEFPTGRTDDILDTLADCIEIMDVPYVRKRRKNAFRRPPREYQTGRHFQTGYSVTCG